MAGRSGRSNPQAAAPARKAKPGQSRKPGKPTVLGRVFARPGVIVAGATFAAVMTGIVANALLLQKGHHPSPLLNPPPEVAAEPSRPAVPVPPAAPRQALEQPAPSAAPVSAEAPPAVEPAPAAPPTPRTAKKPAGHAAAPHAVAGTHKTAPAVHQDLIGQLLGKQDAKLR